MLIWQNWNLSSQEFVQIFQTSMLWRPKRRTALTKLRLPTAKDTTITKLITHPHDQNESRASRVRSDADRGAYLEPPTLTWPQAWHLQPSRPPAAEQIETHSQMAPSSGDADLGDITSPAPVGNKRGKALPHQEALWTKLNQLWPPITKALAPQMSWLFQILPRNSAKY